MTVTREQVRAASKKITITQVRKAVTEVGGKFEEYERGDKTELQIFERDYEAGEKHAAVFRKVTEWLGANGCSTGGVVIKKVGYYIILDWSGAYESEYAKLVRANID